MQGPKIIITGDDRFTPKMESLQKRMRSMGESLSNVSGAIMSRFILPLAVGLGATAKVGADIQDVFNRISVNTGLAGEALKRYKEQVLDIATSATSTFRPLEIANTVADLVQAGFNEKSALVALPDIMKSAQASGANLAETTDALVSSLTQFGFAADQSHRVLNGMSVVSNATKATFDNLKEGMKNAGAIGNAFNLSFERTLAIVGRFQQGGILPAESGTAFRSLELAMTKPMGRAVEIWKQAKEQFNIDPRDINGNLRDPIKVIEELSAAMDSKKMGSGAKGYILAELFGSYASTAVLGLIKDVANKTGVTVDYLEEQIKRQNNLLDDAAKIRATGVKALFTKAWGEIEVQMIRMFDKSMEERLVRILGKVTMLFRGLSSLDKGTLDSLINLFVTIAGITVSAAILGKLFTIYANIANIAKLLVVTFGTGGAALIVAGVVSIVAAITTLLNTLPKLSAKETYIDQVTGETDLAVAFLQPIYDAWKQITGETQSAIDKKLEYLKMTGDEKRAERAVKANEEMLAAIEKAQGFKANWGRALNAAGTVIADTWMGWNQYHKDRIAFSLEGALEMEKMMGSLNNGKPLGSYEMAGRMLAVDAAGHAIANAPGAANAFVQNTLAPGMAQSARNVQNRYNNGGQYEARIVFENAPSGMRVVEKAPPSGMFNFFTSFNRGVSLGTP